MELGGDAIQRFPIAMVKESDAVSAFEPDQHWMARKSFKRWNSTATKQNHHGFNYQDNSAWIIINKHKQVEYGILRMKKCFQIIC